MAYLSHNKTWANIAFCKRWACARPELDHLFALDNKAVGFGPTCNKNGVEKIIEPRKD